MPRPKRRAKVQERAKAEAKAQLQDLLNEARMLLGLFPDLRDSFDPDELPVSFILKKGAQRRTRKATTRRVKK